MIFFFFFWIMFIQLAKEFCLWLEVLETMELLQENSRLEVLERIEQLQEKSLLEVLERMEQLQEKSQKEC